MNKISLVIQCDIAHNRCSGYLCNDAFYNGEGMFTDESKNTRYMSFTCGGCCGKSVAAKLEHVGKRLRKDPDINKEDVTIYLASCMTTDNHHYDRCPHIDLIKGIIRKHGFENVIEGTSISKRAEGKRESGEYKKY
ncbi:MAG: CGGC domain-containing protein [Firmicutes bacterium]|jgi:predicted metal-binding protein|nr:CGGC domain-containing protein [Bacillota bacterium]